MIRACLACSQRLIETLEADLVKVPPFYFHIESVIAWCMDAIFRLATSGEDDGGVARCGSTGSSPV